MKMKVAIVCDWLTTVGGAEKVLLAIHEMYPDAPIYTSKYDKRGIDWFNDAKVKTGWMQIFPTCMRRFLAPLRQFYFNHLDLSDYDLIISVTGAEAKSVKKGKAKHICYCHVPTQYYWQMYEDYLEQPGFGKLNPLARFGLRLFVRPLRRSDKKAAERPDCFVTISTYAAEQIKKYYNRDSYVVAPPVETEKFTYKASKKRIGYINFSRQVSWKRQDLIIKACIEEKKYLTIIGEGPEHEELVKAANGSKYVRFLPRMTTEELNLELLHAKAFLFPSMEPFGIAPVEALSAGCPVIAYKEGGARDYVIDHKNGLFFNEQTVESLRRAIRRFEKTDLDHSAIAKSAQKFNKDTFKQNLQKVIDEEMSK